jgi:hypothetical protein
MKNLTDLFELVAVAVEQNNDFTSKKWFIRYSGHVNQLDISFYFTGWSPDTNPEGVIFTLNEEGIQGAYWFIKTRL